MSRLVPRIVLALALAVGLFAVPAAPADQPQGQFQPTAGDRDGDGIADSADCAPDDPTRPSRSGTDADCDGVADGDSAPVYSADSSTGPSPAMLRAAARRAAGVPVVAVSENALGPAALFRPRHRQPLLVFAGRAAMRVSVTPTLLYADGRRVKVPRSWSAVDAGTAWAFRMRRSDAQRISLAITVRDGAGAVYRATRALG